MSHIPRTSLTEQFLLAISPGMRLECCEYIFSHRSLPFTPYAVRTIFSLCCYRGCSHMKAGVSRLVGSGLLSGKGDVCIQYDVNTRDEGIPINSFSYIIVASADKLLKSRFRFPQSGCVLILPSSFSVHDDHSCDGGGARAVMRPDSYQAQQGMLCAVEETHPKCEPIKFSTTVRIRCRGRPVRGPTRVCDPVAPSSVSYDSISRRNNLRAFAVRFRASVGGDAVSILP